MEKKYGTKELKDTIDLGFAVLAFIQNNLMDGFQLSDIFAAIDLIPVVEKAIDGYEQVPKELADLDAEEEKEIRDYTTKKAADGELGQVIVEHVFKLGSAVAHAIYDIRMAQKKV